MPNGAVRILIAAGIAMTVLSGSGTQQTHDTSKPVPQPVSAPATTMPGGAPVSKAMPISKDVCEKHPNLKQCT